MHYWKTHKLFWSRSDSSNLLLRTILVLYCDREFQSSLTMSPFLTVIVNVIFEG